jgi:hypothetical protein
MRCPNCGNENPPDYVFCDECGARLTGGADTDVATETADNPGGSSMPASMPDGNGASASNRDGQSMSENPPTSKSKRASGPMPKMSDGDQAATPAPAVTATDSADALDVPVTEDTMAPAASTADDMPPMAASDMDQGSMPDVVPIASDAAAGGAVMDSAAVAEAEVEAPQEMPAQQAGDTGGSVGAWAAAALTQLEEAQQAMARGDWGGFGKMMNDLRATLETIAAGLAPTSAATGGAGGVYERSGGGRPIPIGEMSSRSSGGLSGATLEPAAEAGALSAGGATGEAHDGMARLVVISTGAEMPLPDQEEITVGREDPSSGIFPDVDLTPYGGEEGGVSRRHARLLHIGSDYFVEDLQSTNYTKLDGQRLPAHVRERLEDGARLDFGRIAMIFRRS